MIWSDFYTCLYPVALTVISSFSWLINYSWIWYIWIMSVMYITQIATWYCACFRIIQSSKVQICQQSIKHQPLKSILYSPTGSQMTWKIEDFNIRSLYSLQSREITGVQHDESCVQGNTKLQEHNDKPIFVNRKKTTPAHITENMHQSPKMRKITPDLLWNIGCYEKNLETRFDQHEMQVLKVIESCLLNAANKEYTS